ncbi:hypothetical protein DLM78_02475 [Leptospira stimsonii]|uniref:Uncharacterized protein n=1 Tax=Leptospira stimsonii TaxID=2202203 RepID=A0A8B3CWP4_9LEPT|nr:hypothetical protein DLM78_02475 [Leptospira stimsonii]
MPRIQTHRFLLYKNEIRASDRESFTKWKRGFFIRSKFLEYYDYFHFHHWSLRMYLVKDQGLPEKAVLSMESI